MSSPTLLQLDDDVTTVSRLLTLVGVVVVIAGLYFGRSLLIPLALAVVLAFFLTPIVALLEKCRLRRTPSVIVVLILSFALTAAFGWGVTSQLMDVVAHFPDYRTNIDSKIASLQSPAGSRLGKATSTVNDLRQELSTAAENAGSAKISKPGNQPPISVQLATPPRNVVEYLRDVVGPLTGLMETAGITVILALFLLVKREDVRNRVLRLAGSRQLNVMTQALDDASQRLGRYLLMQFAVNAGYGVLFATGVHLLGIPHPLLWGVFACLFRFVPYIGTAVAAIFPMVLAAAIFPGWSQGGLTFALFVILELLIGNILEPWLYGSHTGVSPLAILVAAIFWGMMWGPIGLILSTPLTLCLILLGRYVPQLAFLEILLGDEPVLSPELHFYQRLLALDDQEARDVADVYLKENSLESFYDSVLIPVLGLAEQDQHVNGLDEGKAKFVYQSTRELVEELNEGPAGAVANEVSPGFISTIPSADAKKIVCIPASDEVDEVVSVMAQQVLHRAGYDAEVFPLGHTPALFEQWDGAPPDFICISALTPFALRRGRSLCKQLKQKYPDSQIILGLWDFPGALAKPKDKLAPYADKIATSLQQTLSFVGVEDQDQSRGNRGAVAAPSLVS
jgi:predicted PurR-regulated permease PerM